MCSFFVFVLCLSDITVHFKCIILRALFQTCPGSALPLRLCFHMVHHFMESCYIDRNKVGTRAGRAGCAANYGDASEQTDCVAMQAHTRKLYKQICCGKTNTLRHLRPQHNPLTCCKNIHTEIFSQDNPGLSAAWLRSYLYLLIPLWRRTS